MNKPPQKHHLHYNLQQALDALPTLIVELRVTVVVGISIFYLVLGNIPQHLSVHYDGIPEFSGLSIAAWAFAYVIFIILMLLMSKPRLASVIDIVMMVLLTYLGGGIDTGLGILVLPFVLTSCVGERSTSGIAPLIYAALSTILLLCCSLLVSPEELTYKHWFEFSSSSLFNAALLSSACFVVAWLSTYASRNLRIAHAEMLHQQEEINQLNQLNKMVLKNASEGIVVLDGQCTVKLLNQQAQVYFPTLTNHALAQGFEAICQHWQGEAPYFDEGIMEAPLGSVHYQATALTEQPLLLLSLRSEKELLEYTRSHKLAAMGQLVSSLAHEIRNPLSAISQANELLKESAIEETDLHLMQIIKNNVDRLNRMVNEILAFNKSRLSGQVIPSLKKYLDDLIEEFTLSHAECLSCIHTHIPQDLAVNFDAEHLRQILNNLLNNAWKFSQKNSEAIEIQIAAIDDKQAMIRVIDNGQGVQRDLEHHLFEPFFTTSAEGTGLGLYMARQLAEANKAHLSYYRNEHFHAFDLILTLEHRHGG